MLTSILVSLLLSLLMSLLGRLIFAAEKGRKLPMSTASAQKIADRCHAVTQYLGGRFGIKPDTSNATYAAIVDEARGAREPQLPRLFGKKPKAKGKAKTK